MRLRAGIAVSALALVAAGCGDGDGGGSATEEAAINPVLACIQDEGLNAVATGPDEPLGITDSLRVTVSHGHQITVDFFGEPEQASDYAASQSVFFEHSGGSSELVGDNVVVGSLEGGVKGELARVKRCVG